MLETLRSVMRFRRFRLDPVARRLARAANVHDLRVVAPRRLPRGVFDYIDGGAEDERTMAENSTAFHRIGFHPRILRGVGVPDPSTTLLGRPLPLPLVLAPTGFTRIADPDGEVAGARAAAPAPPPRRGGGGGRRPPPAPACRTRSPPWAPARSRRSPRSATAACGSRST